MALVVLVVVVQAFLAELVYLEPLTLVAVVVEEASLVAVVVVVVELLLFDKVFLTLEPSQY
jgi:hypothetical protein